MNGLELARSYYEEYGKPMLTQDFPELLPYLAVGFVGSGSEHYGFDDQISRDHDYEPGFCIFLPGEELVSRREEFLLERAYSKLPKEFCGVKRQPLSPVGGSRNGVIRTADFYRKCVGSPDGMLNASEWLSIPDYALAEAVNGEVYYDGYGEFTRIRKELEHMPEDILLKRLAGSLLVMAQAGQYNFSRCISHGEPEAAQLACTEFATAAMRAAFLLRGKYMPYYKWSFRALRALDGTSELRRLLSLILCGDNRDPAAAAEKQDAAEQVCAMFISELEKRGLSEVSSCDLEKHAYSVNDRIRDGDLRNLSVFAAV